MTAAGAAVVAGAAESADVTQIGTIFMIYSYGETTARVCACLCLTSFFLVCVRRCVCACVSARVSKGNLLFTLAIRTTTDRC